MVVQVVYLDLGYVYRHGTAPCDTKPEGPLLRHKGNFVPRSLYHELNEEGVFLQYGGYSTRVNDVIVKGLGTIIVEYKG